MPTRTTVLTVAAAFLLVGGAAAVPSVPSALPGPAVAGPGTQSIHVHIADFAFAPQDLVILAGETVDWDNHDFAPHTVTADDFSFDSGNMGNGATYQRTFDTPGTIPYHCEVHPSMTARIIVSDPTELPDLVVSGLTTVDVIPGVTKRVNITVRNLAGAAAADASKVALVYESGGHDHPIGTADVPLLGPGESRSVTIEWGTVLKVGDFVLRATADSEGDVDESDESNNDTRATSSVLVAGVEGIDLLDP